MSFPNLLSHLPIESKCLTRRSWERSLGKKDVSLFLALWKEKLPRLNIRSRTLNAVAGQIILNGMHAYGWTNDAISNTSSRLRDALLRHCPALLNQQEMSTTNTLNDAKQFGVSICTTFNPPSNVHGLAGSRGSPQDSASDEFSLQEEPLLTDSWNDSFAESLSSIDSWVNTNNTILDTIQANDYLSTTSI